MEPPLLHVDSSHPTILNMNLFEFIPLAASLTTVLIGPTSADRPKGSDIPTNNYPSDLLASRIEGLLTGPAAGQVLPLNLADKPAVQAFYTRRSYSAAWCKDTGTGAKDRTELALLTQAGDYELMTMLHHVPQLQTLPDSLARAAGTGGQMERLARSACC